MDTHSLVAFENTCQYEIKRVGGAGMMFFGGQGIFNTHISGPGLVIVQSISLEKMRVRSCFASDTFCIVEICFLRFACSVKSQTFDTTLCRSAIRDWIMDIQI